MTCKAGFQLRAVWYKTQSKQAKAAYSRHVCNCGECRPDIETLERAVNAWQYPADMDAVLATWAAERSAQ